MKSQKLSALVGEIWTLQKDVLDSQRNLTDVALRGSDCLVSR